MAKAIFAGHTGYQYHAEVLPLQRPEGAYSLSIQTTWAEAGAPHAKRQVLQVTTDADGLQALAGLIARALDTTGADFFQTALRRIFQETPGTGGFAEPNMACGGDGDPHRFALATGWAWLAAAKRYEQQFGSVPKWLSPHHPTHRVRACNLALQHGQALPDALCSFVS